MMDPLLAILQQIGLGVAANAVYDYLRVRYGQAANPDTVENDLQNIIRLHGVQVRAATVIDALAKNGFITIQGSHLYGPKGLAFGSVQGGAIAGNNTRLSTDKTAIDAGPGAFSQTKGNAQIRQNPDGSISFHVGEDSGDSISFHT